MPAVNQARGPLCDIATKPIVPSEPTIGTAWSSSPLAPSDGVISGRRLEHDPPGGHLGCLLAGAAPCHHRHRAPSPSPSQRSGPPYPWLLFLSDTAGGGTTRTWGEDP